MKGSGWVFNYEKFGPSGESVLRRKIRQYGLNISQFSELCGIPPGKIYRILSGNSEASAIEVVKILRIVGGKIEDYWGEEGLK